MRKTLYKLYKKINIPINEVQAEISLILDSLGIDKLKEIKGTNYTNEEITKILEIVEKRVETRAPLQQIIGYSYFMGEKYFVNKHTLIPRPETEILVTESIKKIKSDSKILDIGTGSGCIAIEIAKRTGAKVDAIDISKNAIEIAKKNAKIHNVTCNFFISNLFEKVKGKYDLIVSNPPYIPKKDINSLSETVKDFEPHCALFTKDDKGMDFYKEIIENAVTFLNKNGYVFFESGYNQGNLIEKEFANKGYSNINCVKDLTNIDRIIYAQYKK